MTSDEMIAEHIKAYPKLLDSAYLLNQAEIWGSHQDWEYKRLCFLLALKKFCVVTECLSKRGALECEPYRCFWRLYSPGPIYDGSVESLIPASGPLCPFCSLKVASVLER